MICPIDKERCEGCEYQKEGICDWPYSIDLTPDEIREIKGRE